MKAHNLPALPIAPQQDPYHYPRVVRAKRERGIYEHIPVEPNADGILRPKPAFTGKNPSYLDADGQPHLINHRVYQGAMPNQREHQRWFANPANGMATLGNDRIVFIDIDRKNFESPAECDRAVADWLEAYPALQQTYREKTHSGGWHLAITLSEPKTFTNFAFKPGGKHVGEVLGAGRVCVLAPTYGPSGNRYETQQEGPPLQVATLEAIGLYPAGRAPSQLRTAQPFKQRPRKRSKTAGQDGATPLVDLMTQRAYAIWAGQNPYGDRSFAITTVGRELFGWENWAREHGVPLAGSAFELTQAAGAAHHIDPERIERIINSVEPEKARPAAETVEAIAPWKRLRKINREAYEAYCPADYQDAIAQASQQQTQTMRQLFQEGHSRQSEVLQLAEHILQHVGRRTADGIEFNGRTYGVALSDKGELRLRRNGKTLLRHVDGKTLFNRVTADDVSHFRQCCTDLQQMPCQSTGKPQMSKSKTDLKPIPLAELLAPTATGILNDGRVFKDKNLSLWLFAQDAFGWKNWMEERSLPLEGRAETLLRQAAKQLHLPDETVDHFLAGTPLEQAIPACVYKGDNENGTGEISAWAHVLNLRPEFQPYL